MLVLHILGRVHFGNQMLEQHSPEMALLQQVSRILGKLLWQKQRYNLGQVPHTLGRYHERSEQNNLGKTQIVS